MRGYEQRRLTWGLFKNGFTQECEAESHIVRIARPRSTTLGKPGGTDKEMTEIGCRLKEDDANQNVKQSLEAV